MVCKKLPVISGTMTGGGAAGNNIAPYCEISSRETSVTALLKSGFLVIRDVSFDILNKTT